MTEEEARAAVVTIAPDAVGRLERYIAALIKENARQNLIARSTEAEIWSRHIFDSLQLADFARADDAVLVDVGSGAGLPGLVLASLHRWQVILVEPRRRRVDFLRGMIDELGIANAEVVAGKVETVRTPADLITARAVAPLADLFELTRGCTHSGTRFVLPKGRLAQGDVDLAAQRWHGVFHVEQSLTDPTAGIVIADRVSRR